MLGPDQFQFGNIHQHDQWGGVLPFLLMLTFWLHDAPEKGGVPVVTGQQARA
jgi:hypothetical protein